MLDITLVIGIVLTNLLWMVYTVNLLNSLPRAAGQGSIPSIMPKLKLPFAKGKDEVADRIAEPNELEDLTDTEASIDDVLNSAKKAHGQPTK